MVLQEVYEQAYAGAGSASDFIRLLGQLNRREAVLYHKQAISYWEYINGAGGISSDTGLYPEESFNVPAELQRWREQSLVGTLSAVLVFCCLLTSSPEYRTQSQPDRNV